MFCENNSFLCKYIHIFGQCSALILIQQNKVCVRKNISLYSNSLCIFSFSVFHAWAVLGNSLPTSVPEMYDSDITLSLPR